MVSIFVGEVLSEVLLALKSFGTSNVAMYSYGPSNEKPFGIIEGLLIHGIGNATTKCEAIWKNREVVLEGIFLVRSVSIFFCSVFL